MKKKEFLEEFGATSEKYNQVRDVAFQNMSDDLVSLVGKYGIIFGEVENNSLSEIEIDSRAKELNSIYKEIVKEVK